MGEMRVWVIVAAGGSSSRFGDRDKLSEDLGGRAVIRRSVELFTKRAEVAGIVVVGPRGDFEGFRARHGDALGMLGCRLVAGGERARWESVRAGLSEVGEDATHIAVHDGARPCASEELIDRVFAAAAEWEAVVPGVAVRDTLKRVSEEEDETGADPLDAILGDAGKSVRGGRRVVETLDRAGVVAVQTPQVFSAGLLRRAYEGSDLASTDDAGLVERLGEAVRVVEGEVRNIKITEPSDLVMAAAILGVRTEAGRPAHKRF